MSRKGRPHRKKSYEEPLKEYAVLKHLKRNIAMVLNGFGCHPECCAYFDTISILIFP